MNVLAPPWLFSEGLKKRDLSCLKLEEELLDLLVRIYPHISKLSWSLS